MIDRYIQQIEEVGYCKIPQVYSQEQVRKALDLALNWFEKSQSSLSDNIPFLNRNHPMVYNLQSKDYYFLELLFGPVEIQQILLHFLNDPWYKQISQTEPNYILRSYLARSSNDALPMHIDSFVPYTGSHVFAMQISIILEEQNETNGSTIVVPGSHQAGQYVDQNARLDAVAIESQAGDVVIWDSRLWHGTGPNKSDRTRWAIIATFVRWWIKQGFDIPRNMPQEIYEQLTPSQKAVMGFCSIPYPSESDGIDMKSGYELLRHNVADYR